MNDGFLYIAQIVCVIGILMWGKLEWHAAVLAGIISPVLTLVLSFLIPTFLIPLPKGIQITSSLLLAVALVIVGCAFLAISLRKKKPVKQVAGKRKGKK